MLSTSSMPGTTAGEDATLLEGRINGLIAREGEGLGVQTLLYILAQEAAARCSSLDFLP